MNHEFPLIILSTKRYIFAPLRPTPMDRIWLLLVPVETEVDLQLLQTRCVVIQLAMNRSRRVSVVLPLMAVLLT